ncbi:hypothetical protein Plhal304r1_c012g0047711 [Plasmopara halstedii]
MSPRDTSITNHHSHHTIGRKITVLKLFKGDLCRQYGKYYDEMKFLFRFLEPTVLSKASHVVIEYLAVDVQMYGFVCRAGALDIHSFIEGDELCTIVTDEDSDSSGSIRNYLATVREVCRKFRVTVDAPEKIKVLDMLLCLLFDIRVHNADAHK